MKKTVDSYELEIQDGDPPDQDKTSYDTKMPSGALFEIARRIKPGQYVENLSAGSLGKLRRQIEERGLTVIQPRIINRTCGSAKREEIRADQFGV